MFSRTLKVEIALRARVMTGFCPAISDRSAAAEVDLLGVVDRFADAHVQHDLVELRHFERILVPELLGELRHDLVLIDLLQTSDIVLRRSLHRAGRGDLRAAFLARLAFSLGVRRRVRFAALGSGLFRLAGLGALLALLALRLSHRSGLRNAWRRAPCGRRREFLKPTRVGLPVLGSAIAKFERWIVDSLVMIPPSVCGVWRVWRRTRLTPATMARLSVGITWRTSPLFPLSRPARTMTLSPFLILAAITAPPGRARGS